MKKNINCVNNDISKDSIYLIYTPTYNSLPFLTTGAGHFKAYDKYLISRSGLNMYLAIFTLAGSGEIFYNDKLYTVHPGQIFLINGKYYHRYKPAQNETCWEFKWVRFVGDNVLPFYQYINESNLDIISMDINEIEHYFDETISLISGQNNIKDFILCNLISNLLTKVCSSKLAELSTDKDSNIITDAKQFILDNYTNKISISSLAQKYYLNKYSFIRSFKKQVGISPYAFLINTRINKAKTLLERTQIPVVQISAEVGFDNINNFIRNFKSRLGITPSQYRKILQAR